jgi:hypothetical protein
MAYRAPRYSYHHAARDRGAGNVTISDTEVAAFPQENMADDRAGTVFLWTGTPTNPTVDIDLGEAPFETGYNRLILPPSHNVERLTVEQADNEDFDSNLETLHADNTDPVAETLYDSGEFDTQASDRRYIRITFTGSSAQWLSQLVLTKINTLTVGPTLADAPDGKIDNVTTLIQNTGRRPSIQHGPQQRVLEYPYEYALSGDDLTTMEALIAAVGMAVPFFVDPASFSTPPETDEPALWMKFSGMPESRLAVDVPMNATRSKTFRLSLIESLD